MRIRCVSIVPATLLGLSVAVDPLILPLKWFNRQAYVVDATINGQATQLQLGTMTSDVWLACARFGAGTCSPDKSDASITVESKTLSVTAATGSTLSLGTVSNTLTFPDVTLKIAQYHPQDANFTPSTWTSGGQVYSSPDYSSEQPPLVRTDIQGVLGLGPNNDVVPSVGKSSSLFGNASVLDKIQSFALYLVRENDGVGSFVQLGGDGNADFDPLMLAGRGLTARYMLPLRGVSSKFSGNLESWDVSLTGVQFGGDTALYPRKYDATEKPGGDATAVLSLNHALLLMPYDVKRIFEKRYLSSCRYGKMEPVGYYFSCNLSLLGTLPRISLYVNDKVFFLDPIDYTHVSPTNSSALIMEIWTTGSDRTWILGAPFLRKFPTIFSQLAQTVGVYCSAGSSCRLQLDAFARVSITDEETGNATSGSSSHGYGSAAMTAIPPTNSPPYYIYSQSPQLLPWITWIMVFVATALVLVFLAGLVRTWMHKREARRQGLSTLPTGDTGTVASERDLEEAKRDLQLMLGEEDAEATRHGEESFVPLQSPSEATTRRL